MWQENLFNILDTINNVILYVIGVPFFLQLFYMIIFWIPKKTFPKSDKINKVAIMIPAHNEESVIFDTIRLLKEKQTYPHDMFDIYVVADNCTDNTAALAMKAGAYKVYTHTDDNPKHHMVGYALDYAYKHLLKEETKYAYVIRLDADNHVNDEFISLMNDAYNTGAKICRPYESALNMTQNGFTEACGLYYIFDSRCGSRARERLHIDAHVNGPGSLIDMQILEETNGYDTTSICEDTEFNFKRMMEGVRCHFVEDAVVYEDLPSTLKDTLSRNRRIGAGNTRLLFKYTPKLFFYAFKNLNFSFIEAWLNYLFCLLCPILCIWLPAFYIYAYIYKMCLGDWAWVQSTTILICAMVGTLFVLCGLLQATIMVISDYKKMGAKNRRELIPGILLFPIFSIVYVITITIGVFSKPKWGKVNRNPKKDNNVSQ